MATRILGISAYYHDSAACLVRDGEIVAAAQEERFTRKKHDAALPAAARSRTVCEAGGIRADQLDYVGFYDKPLLKFERLLENYIGVAPRGLHSFLTAMPVWLKEKLFTRDAHPQASSAATRARSSSPSTTSRTPRARSIPRRSRGRGADHGRRRRVGDVVLRRRRRQRRSSFWPSSTTRTRSACSTPRSPTTPASR